jgi:hypothetical protein
MWGDSCSGRIGSSIIGSVISSVLFLFFSPTLPLLATVIARMGSNRRQTKIKPLVTQLEMSHHNHHLDTLLQFVCILTTAHSHSQPKHIAAISDTHFNLLLYLNQ